MTSSIPRPITGGAEGSPFDLDDERAYLAWRERKLAGVPRSIEELCVTIQDGCQLSGQEMDAVHKALQRANFAIYAFKGSAGEDKALIRQLGRQLGLERLDDNLCSDEDGITSLKVVEKRREGEYIPYTSKRLNWHTDGYYNSLDRQIRGVILHCVQPAAAGGESALMDHEITYIQLRDKNPGHIQALMAADAMTIPPNVQSGKQIRPEQGGPVFSVAADGHLHMRYSARARNIVWKDDSSTQAAVEFLLSLFQQDSPYIFRHRLKSGQGILTNNVLHCRSSFEDDTATGQTRLLYRARYFDRIVDPGSH
ncbi:MAG: TauD/TfdA family dioxygenase [Pseudomonadota bacterium]|nr:TauD/TfdA family dioxygenase [Pseudomonadota bacterium]